MKCPKCNKKSRCGCKSCKSRVKFPSSRASGLRNHPEHKGIGLIKCPYCRKEFTEDYLMDLEFTEKRNKKWKT